ncbi:MAG: molybdate ABC transporter substrate-binding protein [Gammaproteobacteria bacterium]|nr:molybdate ABC transporter substrate-binding protein [Gammaproteobacteria bacterium]
MGNRHSLYLRYLLLSLTLIPSATAAAETLKLAIANSTCDIFSQVNQRFSAAQPIQLELTCKASGLLAKGLQGKVIDADLFISANQEWMDYMIKEKLVNPEEVTTPWRNHLVVATARSSALAIDRWEDLASPAVQEILIGDPSLAPFGRYAKQALQRTDLWPQVIHKISSRKNIAILAEDLNTAGEGSVGILFGSNLTPGHRLLFRVNPDWHDAVRYYMAPLANSTKRDTVAKLISFLASDPITALFTEHGYISGQP